MKTTVVSIFALLMLSVSLFGQGMSLTEWNKANVGRGFGDREVPVYTRARLDAQRQEAVLRQTEPAQEQAPRRQEPQPQPQQEQARRPQQLPQSVDEALKFIGASSLAVRVRPCSAQGAPPQPIPSPVQVYPYGYGYGYGGYGWLEFTPPFPVEKLTPVLQKEAEFLLSRRGLTVVASKSDFRLVLTCWLEDEEVEQKSWGPFIISGESQKRTVSVVLYGELQDSAGNLLFYLKGRGRNERREVETRDYFVVSRVKVRSQSVQAVAEQAAAAILTDPRVSEIQLAAMQQQTSGLEADVKNAKKIVELGRKRQKLEQELAKLASR